MSSELIGVAELTKALTELGDFSVAEWKTTLRAAVGNPMRQVMRRAQDNIKGISPGKAFRHRSYLSKKGDPVWLYQGYASRNIRMVVVVRRDGSARAVLGVRRQAFYALQFLELGTARIPRRPWLVPALEASKDSAVREVGEAMRKRIEAIARRRANAGSTRGLV